MIKFASFYGSERLTNHKHKLKRNICKCKTFVKSDIHLNNNKTRCFVIFVLLVIFCDQEKVRINWYLKSLDDFTIYLIILFLKSLS